MSDTTKEIVAHLAFFVLLVGGLLVFAHQLEQQRARDRRLLVECVEDHDYAHCDCLIYDNCFEDTQ